METANHLVPISTAAGSSSCHGGRRSSGGWLSRRRGLVIGGVVVAAAIALALGQHWLTIAALTPLLFLLPCALMMFMCMKGHGRQTDQASATDKLGGEGTGPN